ncbi:hypothetical protein HLH34_04310 [Gluconacetobacter azotocaptans]|uniref:Transposase n=1 Tax=Gluconacetobacter azotocaptans TaxID=142834 RepID=A0A7W4JR07_9PROT|nr:hypothetical protein [Gluconacetobacter azotocaptans]MBB2189187.1 hypothetical protein [Gluconacetobacter azotocaptans]GBQ32186.1 hypothetical protein AA13594_2295 [Gluconacetobacter azotocaptans DSM 13594]
MPETGDKTIRQMQIRLQKLDTEVLFLRTVVTELLLAMPPKIITSIQGRVAAAEQTKPRVITAGPDAENAQLDATRCASFWSAILHGVESRRDS